MLAPALLWAYFPAYSHDEAKALVRDQVQSAGASGIAVLESDKRTFSLANSGNPFVAKGYYFLVDENGEKSEYVVNPVDGSVLELNA
ncbi:MULTISPECIES: hypothetical protein [Cohnella]|uniref:hypothetical protein n=1 Tax=Cohnella TaxID=329857 RepID=UPI0009BBA7CF|nr:MULTISPECIES: hypothetical protein [Cohnella]MBN2984178.1 hypothetical protein [Cohnella algarum]